MDITHSYLDIVITVLFLVKKTSLSKEIAKQFVMRNSLDTADLKIVNRVPLITEMWGR